MHPARITARRILAAGLLVVAAGCASTDNPASAGPPAPVARPVVSLHRSPDCTCCSGHLAHLREAGFQVIDRLEQDMAAFKQRHGIPESARSCHTSVVGGYVVEGHVPAEAVQELLAQRPDVDGLALPGMPQGAPGMGGTASGPLPVMALDDGLLEPWQPAN